MPKQDEKPRRRVGRQRVMSPEPKSGKRGLSRRVAGIAADERPDSQPAADVSPSIPEYQRLSRPHARRVRWLALAGTALLALIAGAGLLRWRLSRSPKPQSAIRNPQSEDPTEARLRRAVAARPDDGAARRELGSYYEEHARPFEAMWEYAEARRHQPTDTDLSVRLASVLQNGGLVDLATAQLVQALRADPVSLELRPHLAELYLKVAEPQRARRVMEARRSSVWQDAEAVTVLGRALHAAGDAEGASAAFKRSLALQPQQAEVWYRLGRLYLGLGRSEEARDALFHAMTAGGSRPEYALYTGMTYLQQNRPADLETAISFFKEAVAARSNYAPAFYQHGVALQRLGRRKEALSRYSFAILSDTLYPEPNLLLGRGLAASGNARDGHRYLGRYYDLLDRPAEAAREFRAMRAAAPQSVQSVLLESQVYVRTQQEARAVAVTEAALQRRPNEVQLLERLAVLKINRGDRPYARRLLHRWLKLNPKASRPCWLLGRCDFGDLKYSDGIAWEEKALQRQPRNPDYLAFLGGGLLKLGTPGSLDRAAQVLSQAVALSSDNPEYRDLYAQALQRLGRYEEARRQFLQALDIDSLRVSCYAPLAQLAWRLNRPAPAALYPPIIRSVQQRRTEEGLLWSRVWHHPEDAEAHLKLAHFLCRTADLTKARRQLDQALELRPNWPAARQLLATVLRAQEAM
jgi:tetratricopeptide (TPR) repeat protein